MNLSDRDRAVLWHPYTQMRTAPAPLPIVRGEGAYLYTEDGRRILDGISSWWVNIHGHAHPKLNEALAAQARELEHVVFAGCTHRPAVELAERLLEILPTGLARIFYSDNGSTAVEVALKMAIQYWRNRGEPQRRTFIALRNAYHGDTIGAMSTSEDSVFTRAFQPLLFPVERAGNLEELEASLRKSVAAVIIEPMLQGAGGMIVWPAEFVAGVRQLCDRYDTPLIADEVLTGFGRTGKMFACEHAAITPDIMCLSKALTAGYLPLGVTATSAAIYDAFLSEDHSKTFFHGHSFTANPLACAVALASLDLFRNEPVLANVARLERQLRAGFEPVRKFGNVSVIGGMGAVELSGKGYLDQLGPQLAAAFLERGLLLRPLGNVVYFLPPYCISESDVEWALAQITNVFQCSASLW
ncbi:MAG: adenosylmethionine--8-amino-7-oxononanoate transaminase [Bryobacteraceae bacterium]